MAASFRIPMSTHHTSGSAPVRPYSWRRKHILCSEIGRADLLQRAALADQTAQRPSDPLFSRREVRAAGLSAGEE
jgi:hypothetical protein